MRHATIGDCALIAALTCLALALLFVLPGSVVSGGSRVVVRSGDRIVGRYSLNEDRRITVAGPLGQTVIRIENGRTRIESSPCPHKTCIRMGDVGSEGGLLVCVPNEISVTVGGERTNAVDAVSR